MSKSNAPHPYPKVPDVAKVFGVHERTVWDWVYRGIIPFRRVGRNVYFTWADIEAHMDENRYIGSVRCPIVSPSETSVPGPYLGYERLPAHAVVQTPQGPIPSQVEMPFSGVGVSAPKPFIKVK